MAEEVGEKEAWRSEGFFCKCQEQRVDGFINPLSPQNTWRRRGEEERGWRLVREVEEEEEEKRGRERGRLWRHSAKGNGIRKREREVEEGTGGGAKDEGA